jgi:hypothetical protein
MSSQDEEPVTDPCGGVRIQRPQLVFEALPRRPGVAFRKRGVRTVGSFNESKVCRGLGRTSVSERRGRRGGIRDTAKSQVLLT